MKRQYIFIVLILCSISAGAFNVKGKILADDRGKDFNGNTLYLYENPEGKIYEEWTGTKIVDSCVIENNTFSLNAENSKYATSYKLATRGNFLYYFVNSNSDLDLQIINSRKYKCYRVKTSTNEQDSLTDYLIEKSKYKKLEDDERIRVDNFLASNNNYVYQQFVKQVNEPYFNPYLKRKAINFLKDHIKNDGALYLLALYSSKVPDRFQREPFFTHPQMQEVLKIIPDEKKINPLYKIILKNAEEIEKNYKKPDGYRIKGYMNNVWSNYAVLVLPSKEKATKLQPVDTVPVVNGYFEFTGKVDYPQYGLVTLLGASFHKTIFLENSDIEVNLYTGKTGCNYKDSWLHSKVWGVNFYSFVNGSKSLDEYEEFKEVCKKGYKDIGMWIKNHPFSDAALCHVASSLCKTTSPAISKKWLKSFDRSLRKRPMYAYALKEIETKQRTSGGAGAPKFTLPNVAGKKVSLKDFRGKYVLLDFWASWCGPCKAEMPNIKEAYEKYKDKGLVVISISSDRKKEAWLNAIKHEKMTWIQLNSSGSRVASDYGVSGIPHLFLIDPKGNIVANGLRGKAIIGEIGAIIDKK